MVREGILFGNANIQRALKWFVYLSLFYNGLLIAIVPEYRTAGLIYLALGLITLVFYYVTKNKSVFFGLRKGNIGKKVLVGIGIAGGLLFIGKILPGFTILIPSLSLSILGGIRYSIVGIIAPSKEEPLFQDILLNLLMNTYGLSFWIANTIKSIGFMFYHLLVYGVILGALPTLTALFGAVTAISGLLFMAFLFSFIVGYVAFRFKDLLPGWIAHWGLNTVLFSTGFFVVTV